MGWDNSSKVQGEELRLVHLRAILSILSLIATERSAALLYMWRRGVEKELGMTPRRVGCAGLDVEERARKLRLKVTAAAEDEDEVSVWENDWLWLDWESLFRTSSWIFEANWEFSVSRPKWRESDDLSRMVTFFMEGESSGWGYARRICDIRNTWKYK